MEQIAEFSKPWLAPKWGENSAAQVGLFRAWMSRRCRASGTRGVLALWEPPLHLLAVLAALKAAVSGAAGVRRAASSDILLPVAPGFAQCGTKNSNQEDRQRRSLVLTLRLCGGFLGERCSQLVMVHWLLWVWVPVGAVLRVCVPQVHLICLLTGVFNTLGFWVAGGTVGQYVNALEDSLI